MMKGLLGFLGGAEPRDRGHRTFLLTLLFSVSLLLTFSVIVYIVVDITIFSFCLYGY